MSGKIAVVHRVPPMVAQTGSEPKPPPQSEPNGQNLMRVFLLLALVLAFPTAASAATRCFTLLEDPEVTATDGAGTLGSTTSVRGY